MFTVCPKCALTLVVTAADLRVAQGYVRCGRCSNVFNALARLSDDRQATSGQAQASPEAPRAADATASSRRSSADPVRARTNKETNAAARAKPDPFAPGKARPAPEGAAKGTSSGAPDSTASRSQSEALARKPAPITPPAVPAKAAEPPQRFDDDSIPEEALEFNPDSTDVNKVFVEQAPSAEFTAATGTFQALRLEAEETARTRATERGARTGPLPDSNDAQVDIEIDAELLAEITSNKLTRLNLTPATDPVARPGPAGLAAAPAGDAAGKPLATAPAAAAPPSSALPAAPVAPFVASSVAAKAGATARTEAQSPSSQAVREAGAAKQPAMSRPATASRPAGEGKALAPAKPIPELARPPALADGPMRLAERAKARAQAARASSLETAEAIRTALLPRKRKPSADAKAGAPETFWADPRIWTAGTALLGLLLLGQIVHHYRHDLAAVPAFRGIVTGLYSALGISVVPRWNLGAYEVRQLGASTTAEAPGQITVRASVKNGAHQSQPLPLLRVTLQDRFGNRIASRDVAPSSYLPHANPAASLLSSGQRIDAEMQFVDPGSNAVGFEIDACLPAPGGGIACANDLIAR